MTFLDVNLSVSLAALVTGANSLPVHVYCLLPMTAVANLLFLLLIYPALGSIHPESQASKFKMKKAIMHLKDLDRETYKLFKRKIRAQRCFGFRLGRFSFISINTAQDVITNSVSNALLIIELTRM